MSGEKVICQLFHCGIFCITATHAIELKLKFSFKKKEKGRSLENVMTLEFCKSATYTGDNKKLVNILDVLSYWSRGKKYMNNKTFSLNC